MYSTAERNSQKISPDYFSAQRWTAADLGMNMY